MHNQIYSEMIMLGAQRFIFTVKGTRRRRCIRRYGKGVSERKRPQSADKPRKRKNPSERRKRKDFLLVASTVNANCSHLRLGKLPYLHFCFLALQGFHRSVSLFVNILKGCQAIIFA